MKVNVSVEATAQEMREFLGLPNVQPLHDDILQTVRDSVQRGVINFDALGLMKPLLPTQFHSMEMVQNSGKPSPRPVGETSRRPRTQRIEKPRFHQSRGQGATITEIPHKILGEQTLRPGEGIWPIKYW